MIGRVKLANKTCTVSVVRMNSAKKKAFEANKPSQATLFLFELL
jgi:hypothetical protein